jgi:hypothetical protein
MSTLAFNVAPDITQASTFYNWAHRISAFMGTAGWIQGSDTGQVVWPVSIINITNITGNGTTATATYTLLQGPPIRVGGQVKITGSVTAGFNTTVTIATIPTGNTFTYASATNATDNETANHTFGGVNPQVLITTAVGNGSTNTYTYTTLDGSILAGQVIVITNCTTAGFNGTFTIGSLGVGSFTTTTGISHALETENNPQGSPPGQPTGIVTANACATTVAAATTTTTSLPTTTSNTVFEIWKMNDTLQATMPIIVRLDYGVTANSGPWIRATTTTSTDGAGNAGSVTTGIQDVSNNGSANQSTTAFPSYMSGSINRINGAFWEPANTSGKGAFFNIERSHDTTGNDTTEYATMITVAGGQNVAPSITQISINSTNATTTETKLAVFSTHSTTTGDFGPSTLLCPAFPVVGKIGNPIIGVLVGKASDWFDQTQIAFTLYNVTHTYQIVNSAGVNAAGYLTYDATPTSALLFRYE